jgi:hypothetical protein
VLAPHAKHRIRARIARHFGVSCQRIAQIVQQERQAHGHPCPLPLAGGEGLR